MQAMGESGMAAGNDGSVSLKKRVCMGIDLTPVLPGGDNGGAKLLVIELIRHLSRLAPCWQFILLTREESDAELAALDSQNVRRMCVTSGHACEPGPGASPGASPARQSLPASVRLENLAHRILSRFLPLPVRIRMDQVYRRALIALSGLRLPRQKPSFLRQMGIDLLFCPFTAPFYYDPAVPMVSIVYDLQFHYLPQFFSMEDRLSRESHFRESSRLADKVVCISEHTRSTVLENSDIAPLKVVTVYIRLANRVGKPSPSTVSSVLELFGLRQNEFLFYPANFWPHKNHRMLLTAFGIYVSRHPESELKLVCPGSIEKEKNALQESVERMGLSKRVILPGYIPDEQFAALLDACLAVIFPSLFEGFGMPVLEAMAFGKPIICSNTTSLPEVAGDAAYYIDPRKPSEIADAIAHIAAGGELRARLIDLGIRRAAEFGGPEEMASEYLDVFLDVLAKPKPGRRMPGCFR